MFKANELRGCPVGLNGRAKGRGERKALGS